MYEPVSNSVNFPALERDILEYWKRERIFEKSLKLSPREMVFYDGPPFPTGTPHFGTIFVSILKDALARFFTMDGYAVPRRWGWDCHGLPIENAVEKKLGVKDKTQIEKTIGVAAFNDACRALVSDCNENWKSYINKIGRWVDYENAYRTLDKSYMESVLWVFKQCHDKGLIYKDYRVTPYCYRCETSLSISDTRESDSTRPRQDPEVIIRFRAGDGIGGLPTWYLAWTTTPWTLISNLALAVGPDFGYAAVEHEGQAYVLSEAALPKLTRELGEQPKVLARMKGSELVGRRYAPVFPHFRELAAQGYFRILAGEFVTLEDGTGIVHMAPAYGEDDYWLCKRNGLGVKNPVDAKGCFTAEIPEYAGRNVHDCNKDIIRRLKEQGDLVRHSTVVHNYPHCWRCRSPLIYRAMDAWYFSVEKIKDRLLKHNEAIGWVPEHIREGRFGKWLEGARDWNISRSRFWGTPIPVWECGAPGCGERVVAGSVRELEAMAGRPLQDIHKEFLDAIRPACPRCGALMQRVSEVLDCWFESGSMPFGQCHYPFENKDWFEKHFPADFIVEYPGQLRGWFYYLHVLAVAILDRPSFKHCLVHGTLLAEDGSKISKSKKNFTDPMTLIDTYGADALRLYLLNSQAVVMEDLNFRDAGVQEQIRDVLLPVWNAFSFFVTYANIDSYTGDPSAVPKPGHPLDRWILARLYQTEKEVRKAYRSFYLNQCLGPVVAFIEDLTNWYIRQSRGRFWGGGMTPDKKSAYDTLYFVLTSLARLFAPSAPFVSERIYRRLAGGDSVHLAAWPEIPGAFRNDALIEEVRLARLVASLGLSLRQKAGIKVRQPLSLLTVALPKNTPWELLAPQLDVLRNELNVKRIEFMDQPEKLASAVATPNLKRLGPKLGRDTQAVIVSAKAGQVREEGNSIVVFHKDGREWRMDRQDVSITYQGRDGAEVMSDRGIVVALDKTLTEDLVEEGVANEVNRAIQNMRKEAGYQVSDRIELCIEGRLQPEWAERLAALALAELKTIPSGQADGESEVAVEGRTIRVRVRRPNPRASGVQPG